jgi:hypothetical protein
LGAFMEESKRQAIFRSVEMPVRDQARIVVRNAVGDWEEEIVVVALLAWYTLFVPRGDVSSPRSMPAMQLYAMMAMIEEWNVLLQEQQELLFL